MEVLRAAEDWREYYHRSSLSCVASRTSENRRTNDLVAKLHAIPEAALVWSGSWFSGSLLRLRAAAGRRLDLTERTRTDAWGAVRLRHLAVNAGEVTS